MDRNGLVDSPSHSNGSPLVEGVFQTLRDGIQRGDYPVGAPLPSERRLGEKLSVSRVTLRQAIHRLGQEGWLIRRANHQPLVTTPPGIETMGGVKARYIALWLWPAFEDFGAVAIAKGVQRALGDSGFRLYIPHASGVDWGALIESERAFFEEAATDADAAGILAWCVGGEASREALQRVRDVGKPIVFIDRQAPEGFDADFVGTDNLGASRNLVGRLIALGHRRIGYIASGEPVSAVQDRIEGYRQALVASALPFEPSLIADLAFAPYETREENADRVVAFLLDQGDPPTALACVNDLTAMLVVDALGRAGVRVPEDVSVTGFDGLMRWVPGGGRLSTAEQPFERIGEAATSLLLERLASGKQQPFRHLLLDAPWRERGSVASLGQALPATVSIS